jgi:hypothetical protein
MTHANGTVSVDPRQKEAAALLLSAIDLPAPAAQVAQIWLVAAAVCPGLKANQAMLGDRAGQLRRARDLIDQLLTELGEPDRLGSARDPAGDNSRNPLADVVPLFDRIRRAEPLLSVGIRKGRGSWYADLTCSLDPSFRRCVGTGADPVTALRQAYLVHLARRKS